MPTSPASFIHKKQILVGVNYSSCTLKEIHTYLDKVYSTALQVAILRGMHNLRDDVHNPGHADTPTQSGGKMIPSVNIDITRKICNLEGEIIA